MLEQIREILLLHNGKKNPITSAEIAKSLGIVEDDTHAQTRALILECAEKYELPLAANNRGYYLISDQQEYEEYMDTMGKVHDTNNIYAIHVNTADLYKAYKVDEGKYNLRAFKD